MAIRIRTGRNGRLVCCAAVALLVCTACVPASAAGNGMTIWIRDSLREHFPTLAERDWSDYGCRIYRGGSWHDLPAELPERCVLLIHGVDEPGKLWRDAGPILDRAGHTCISFSYPNDQPIEESAAFLLTSLQELGMRKVKRTAIVAHSMGGLVSRDLLTSPALNYPAWAKSGAVPRIDMLIMLGTPNHGSPLASLRVFAEVRDQWVRFTRGEGRLLGWLTDGCGEAGEDLCPDSSFLRNLNSRPLPVGVRTTIIAGIASPLDRDRLASSLDAWSRDSPERVWTWVDNMRRQLGELTDGIGDGAVALESTRLEGVTDHVTVSANHLTMIRNVMAGSDRIPPAIPIILQRLRSTDQGAENALPSAPVREPLEPH